MGHSSHRSSENGSQLGLLYIPPSVREDEGAPQGYRASVLGDRPFLGQQVERNQFGRNELKSCSFATSRRQYHQLEESNVTQGVSRKFVIAEYIQQTCRFCCPGTFKFLITLVCESMPDLRDDDEFKGFLAHIALLTMARRGTYNEADDKQMRLVTRIHGGEFLNWEPRSTAVDRAFGSLTFTLSAYEAAAAEAGNEELAISMFNQMHRCNSRLPQRPGMELLLDYTRTYKAHFFAVPSEDEKQSCRILLETVLTEPVHRASAKSPLQCPATGTTDTAVQAAVQAQDETSMQPLPEQPKREPQETSMDASKLKRR